MKTSLSESADNALAASFSQEETETVNGIPWEYIVSNGKATVTDVPETVSGSVTVPSTLGGYPVMSIGDYAFNGCFSLTSVTIPDGVTRIGEYAFCGCLSLTSVAIPNSVTSIEDYAFAECGNLKSVVFDGNAPVVGEVVFYRMKQGCTAYVRKDSSGWNVPIPGVWNGINIEFRAAD